MAKFSPSVCIPSGEQAANPGTARGKLALGRSPRSGGAQSRFGSGLHVFHICGMHNSCPVWPLSFVLSPLACGSPTHFKGNTGGRAVWWPSIDLRTSWGGQSVLGELRLLLYRPSTLRDELNSGRDSVVIIMESVGLGDIWGGNGREIMRLI